MEESRPKKPPKPNILSFKYSSNLYYEARQHSVKVRTSPSLPLKECVP